jgi:hypothetical protein
VYRRLCARRPLKRDPLVAHCHSACRCSCSTDGELACFREGHRRHSVGSETSSRLVASSTTSLAIMRRPQQLEPNQDTMTASQAPHLQAESGRKRLQVAESLKVRCKSLKARKGSAGFLMWALLNVNRFGFSRSLCSMSSSSPVNSASRRGLWTSGRSPRTRGRANARPSRPSCCECVPSCTWS